MTSLVRSPTCTEAGLLKSQGPESEAAEMNGPLLMFRYNWNEFDLCKNAARKCVPSILGPT